MGRAIDVDKSIVDLDRRLKLVEDALEELVQTRVHHVDLHEDTSDVVADGVEVGKDETFTPPVGKRKKTTKRKTVTVEKSNAEA